MVAGAADSLSSMSDAADDHDIPKVRALLEDYDACQELISLLRNVKVAWEVGEP